MKPHRFDPISFIFGALFTGAGIVALTSSGDLARFHAGRLWPVLVVLLGLALLPGPRSPKIKPAEPEKTVPLP